MTGLAPAMKAGAEKMLDIVVRMWGLPDSLTWASLAPEGGEEEAPAPPPEQPTMESAPEAGAVPQQQGNMPVDVSGSPVITALARAAE